MLMKATQFDDILVKGHIKRKSESLNEDTPAFEVLFIILTRKFYLFNDVDVLVVDCSTSERRLQYSFESSYELKEGGLPKDWISASPDLVFQY